MPRPKSLIVVMEITAAGRSHDCRYNKNHRIEKGVRRLTIRADGDEHHYCLGCARSFLVKDVERLQTILGEVDGLLGSDIKTLST